MGLVGAFCYPATYRSSEIVNSGEPLNLIGGFVVAFASGIAVVVAVTRVESMLSSAQRSRLLYYHRLLIVVFA